MEYIDETMHEDELYHHGILGMHWGRRNGPPYPLSAGKHSASEKKAGWRKSLKKSNKKDDIKDRKTETKEYSEHPDDKYMDSRKFGTQDLDRLTQRFNSERAFNTALREKLTSENMLDEARLKSMSRRDRQELFLELERMETDAAYNRAVRNAVQSQIDLINANRTLYDLQHPKTKWQKAKEATGQVLADIGKNTARSVGTQVATYMIGGAINKAFGDNVVSAGKQIMTEAKQMEKQRQKWENQTKYNNAYVDFKKSEKRKNDVDDEKPDKEDWKEKAEYYKAYNNYYKQKSEYKKNKEKKKEDKKNKSDPGPTMDFREANYYTGNPTAQYDYREVDTGNSYFDQFNSYGSGGSNSKKRKKK